VKIKGGDSENGENWWFLELGYAKVARAWGIAIRERAGCYLDESESGETWLFANAPRIHRVAAVDKLPDLLAKLIEDASETAKKLREKMTAAKEVVAAFGEPTKPKAKENPPANQASTAHQASNAGAALTRAIGSIGTAGVVDAAMLHPEELRRAMANARTALGPIDKDLLREMENARKALGSIDTEDLRRTMEAAHEGLGSIDTEELRRTLKSAEESSGNISASDAVRALKGRRK
jgi:hypothetical protein